jgi:outer membrane protein OmpA-like peptidoglycan-associated protein
MLTIATVSGLAVVQWFLASESVPAVPATGAIIVAQAPPPKCGASPLPPCPAKPGGPPAAPQKTPPTAPQPPAAPKAPPPAAVVPPKGPPPAAVVTPNPALEKPKGPPPAAVVTPNPALEKPKGTPPAAVVTPNPALEKPKGTPPAAVVTPNPALVNPKGPPPAAVVNPNPALVNPKGTPPAAVVTPNPALVNPKGTPPAAVVTPNPALVNPKGPPPAAVVTPNPALVNPKGTPPATGQAGPAGPTGQPPAQVFKLVKPLPGQPGWVPPAQQAQGGRPGQPPVAAAVGFANVQDLRNQRHEHTEAGGRIVIEEPDHRQIVREGGQAFVRHDENERLFEFGEGRHERRGDGDYAIIVRPDGDEIITVTDDDGRLIRRFRRERDGREDILIDNRRPRGEAIFLNLPVPVIGIPQDQYIVDTAVAPEPFIYQTLEAPPLVPIERPYSLDEIRYNVALRDRMRRIDVDTINFDFGSWQVEPDQVSRLQLVAQAMQDIIARNPNEVFLVEGHTDAVGQDVDNLSLSDRRAETVASILTESFQIPPENLTSQGYGSHYLKIQTPDANRQNRRVTVRRITPLLSGRNG